jgi:hypothetical protein
VKNKGAGLADFYFHIQPVARKYGFPEAGRTYLGEYEKPLGFYAKEFGAHAPGLGKGLDEENPGHHRVFGKMPGEKELFGLEKPGSDNCLPPGSGFIHEQKGAPMRYILFNRIHYSILFRR